MKKRFLTMMMAMLMVGSMSITSLAAGWQQNENGKWWQNNDGSWPANSWQWLDGNNDGVAECYYFDGNGYCLLNTKTPDGYTVDGNGAWVVNGAVQTQAAAGNTGTTQTTVASGNYDPAHPLANVVDAWNLRLVYPNVSAGTNGTVNVLGTWNLQALLTNQMDKYVPHTDGWTTNPATGTRVYLANSDKFNEQEQALYNWFVNWLNSMDFQNMSEMDRAKEIQKVLWQGEYDASVRENAYGVLIKKAGACSDYAETAVALAKAMGLKCATTGGNGHEYFFIWVDGQKYYGSNNGLDLSKPSEYDPYITPFID